MTRRPAIADLASPPQLSRSIGSQSAWDAARSRARPVLQAASARGERPPSPCRPVDARHARGSARRPVDADGCRVPCAHDRHLRRAVAALERALQDPSWTAPVEQTGAYQSLPPAVILDLDETVLDNSAFQGQLVRDRRPYTEAAWARVGARAPRAAPCRARRHSSTRPRSAACACSTSATAPRREEDEHHREPALARHRRRPAIACCRPASRAGRPTSRRAVRSSPSTTAC